MAIGRKLEDDLLNDMTKIRAKNNDLWMKVMAIALKSNPHMTKLLIRQIAINDTNVRNALNQIANAPNDPDQEI